MFLIYNFETTTYCNAKCPSCIRTNKFSDIPSINTKHLSANDFEDMLYKNFSYLKNKSDKYFTVCKFCGEISDPLMNPNIAELVDIATYFFSSVEIFTNGGMYNPNWFEKMYNQFRKLIFVFGIDGITEEINKIYRKNVNFKLAFSNMMRLSQMKTNKVIWHFTVFEHNYHQIEDVVQIAKNNNIELLVRVSSRDFNKTSKKSLEKVDRFMNKPQNKDIKFFRCK